MTRVFRYVPHSQIAEYEAQGWTLVSLIGPPHGFYSVLMQAPETEE